MSPAGDQLRRLRRGAHVLRRRAAGTVILAAAGASALVFLVALWAVGLRGGASPLMLALTLLLIAVAAWAGFAIGALTRRLELASLAREAEEATGLADGDVVAALELQAMRATEPSPLARLHERRVGERLGTVRDPALFPVSAPRWRRRLRLAIAASIVAAAGAVLASGAAPQRAALAARTLATPWEAVIPPPLPALLIGPGDTTVSRGDELPVHVRAAGRRSVRLFWRVEGELASSRTLPVDGDSVARGRTGPISALTRYWAEDGRGRSSDTFRVRPVEPLLVTELGVRVVMPAYLGRESEDYSQPVPPLVVPSGARLEIEGRANMPLRSVRVALAGEAPDDTASVSLAVSGNRFSGSLSPSRSGEWAWGLVPAEARGEIVPPLPLSISVIPDSLPSVDIVYPGVDTVMRQDMQLPLVVDARDDIGLRRVELFSWRVSALGTAEEVTRTPIGQGGGQTRVVLRPTLDMRERNLLPGDTVYYYVRVRDGNPAHRAVVSDTFRARLPSLSELREETAERTDRLAADSRQLVDRARDVEREAREAERKAANEAAKASQNTNSSRDQRVSYEATEEARRVLQQASDMEEQIQGMQSRLEELREEMAESGLADPALREKLEQLQELYRELMESGLADEIARLQEALRSLDPEELQRSLRDVAQSVREMQDKLEQSTALLERAAVEQAVKSARMDAEQLAQRQETAASAERQDSAWASAEDRLAAEAEQLMQELEELAERLNEAGADAVADSARAAGAQLESAAGDMQQAARTARSEAGQRSAQAQESARQGSQSAQEAAESLASAEQQLNEDWREEALAAVQRALGESLELAREQSRLSGISGDRVAPRADYPARQLAVREGLDNLLRSLSEASKKTALLDQRTGPAAAEAAERMDALLQRMQRTQGRSRPTPSEGRAIVNSLNNLAAGLMATAQAIEGSQSATGMQEALEQLAQIAQSQQGVGQKTGGLLPMYQAGQQVQEQLSQLAREQAAIAERLREMSEQPGVAESMGRPEEMAVEADEISRRLASGDLDSETVARQERLFRRLLDAGRSLEKEDEDPRKRESEAAAAREASDVRALDPALLSGPRFPHPNQETLSRYPPGYRALIFDYFDRLNESAPAAQPDAAAAGTGAGSR